MNTKYENTDMNSTTLGVQLRSRESGQVFRKCLYGLIFTAVFVFGGCASSLPEGRNTSQVNTNISDTSEVAKSYTSIVPIYSQKISLKIPSSWKAAFEEEKEGTYVMEFIPKAEEINSWRNIVSIQGFKGLATKATPEKFINMLAARFNETCGEKLIYLKGSKGDIDGFPASSAIIGCSEMPNDHVIGVKKGQSEVGLYYVIKGKHDMYVIHKSIREDKGKASLTAKTVSEFIAPILPIEVCKNTGPPTVCQK